MGVTAVGTFDGDEEESFDGDAEGLPVGAKYNPTHP